MLFALSRKLPKLEKCEPHDAWLSIAAYGPSLRKTWWWLKRPIMSVSGAHDFLIERGIVPDYHLDMDPREHKTQFIARPHKEVTYIMASVCHPKTWDALQGHKVLLWHTDSGNWTLPFLKKYDPRSHMIWAGSDCGLGAIQVGGVLGYSRFRLHGFDHSMRGGERHAGPHPGLPQKDVKQVTVKASGRRFTSTDIMMNSAAEVINTLRSYPILTVFYGDGLIQETVRTSSELATAANAWTLKAWRLRWTRLQKWSLDDDPKKRPAPSGYYWDGPSLKRSRISKSIPRRVMVHNT